MNRLPDWEQRLGETVARWRLRTFRWDRDCVRWLADCVIAQTGEDPLAGMRGRYRTKREALRLLAESPLAERLDEKFARIAPAFARRGDIALMQDSALGLVLGGEAMAFGEDGRMTMIPRREWQAVWAVGHE
ncbi:MAG: hypothetical protein GW859_02595 [Sphingomonadales bacterium]|nr:hypothetical protein [Sphingomonadales bacterium]